MRPPLIILVTDDAARVATLHAETSPTPWTVGEYRQMLGDSNHFGLAIVDDSTDALSAFALCQLTAEFADILMVATHPSARRKGYARILLQSLLKRCGERGIARMTLDVAADNAPALQLYHSLSFSEDGRRNAYYRRAEKRVDAILMSRLVAGLPHNERA